MWGGSVSTLVFGPDGSLYAGGGFATAGGVAVNYIARWDGSQLHPLGSGMDYQTVWRRQEDEAQQDAPLRQRTAHC